MDLKDLQVQLVHQDDKAFQAYKVILDQRALVNQVLLDQLDLLVSLDHKAQVDLVARLVSVASKDFRVVKEKLDSLDEAGL